MSKLEDQCTLTLTVSQILPRALLKNIIHSITAGDILLWYRDLLDPYQKNEALLLEDNGQSVSIDEDLVVYGPIRFKEESNIRLY